MSNVKHTNTKIKSIKDITYAIFCKSWGFKDINYDHRSSSPLWNTLRSQCKSQCPPLVLCQLALSAYHDHTCNFCKPTKLHNFHPNKKDAIALTSRPGESQVLFVDHHHQPGVRRLPAHDLIKLRSRWGSSYTAVHWLNLLHILSNNAPCVPSLSGVSLYWCFWWRFPFKWHCTLFILHLPKNSQII